jgi:hypothetical protein
MTSVSLQERLEEATADLSRCQVASDVAEILRVEGVQGERDECTRCPVAVLLMKRLGPGCGAQAGSIVLSAWRYGDSRSVEIATPPAVAAFMAEFDGDPGAEEPIPGGWDEFAVASP